MAKAERTVAPFGSALPQVVTTPPGPASLALAERLSRVESRNVTYLSDDWPVFWTDATGTNVRDADGNVYAADIVVDDTVPLHAKTETPKTHTSFGFATQLCVLDELGHVDRIVAAHDVGRVSNPALCEGQIEGAVHMGLGYALTEELKCVDGWPVDATLRKLGILRAQDMPAVDVLLVEEPEPGLVTQCRLDCRQIFWNHLNPPDYISRISLRVSCAKCFRQRWLTLARRRWLGVTTN